MTRRGRRFLRLFSLCTAVNIFLLYKIHFTGNLRDSWRSNYVESFCARDIPVLLLLLLASVLFCEWMGAKALPWLSGRVKLTNQGNGRDGIVMEDGPDGRGVRRRFWKVFGAIGMVWFFFFLVMYPGTAMNDTIYILQDPWLASRQHPILYNMYTYGLYRLGTMIWNENFGLALISLLQMAAMDYVLTYGILLLSRCGFKDWVCRLTTAYFALAPLFSTYAVSAIKDTPFSIFLFYLLVLLLDAGLGQNEARKDKWFCVRVACCYLGVLAFRSNGFVVVAGTVFVLLFVYRKWRRRILGTAFAAAVVYFGMSRALSPENVEKLFQESAGIPLQQVASVAARGEGLGREQREYLYRLLPEEKWNLYAPCCADVIKWDEAFDRQFLNETKKEFLLLWLDLLPENLDQYVRAYLLNTFGVWGIETRNREQYYQKDIFENSLNLYQESPLPQGIRTFFYRYYCNRFTYSFLSAGTVFWILFAESLYLLCRRRYRLAAVYVPVWLCFVSLMLATPIAFTFRYVFVLAMVFPFALLFPFAGELFTERKKL